MKQPSHARPNRVMSGVLLALVSVVAMADHFSPFPGRFDCPGIGNSLACARSIEGGQHAMAYSALEVDPSDRFVVIHRQLYEGGAYGLLDRSRDVFTELPGYPVFSPDQRWIAVADLDANSATLQICSVRNGTLKKVFDANPRTWGPGDVAWISSSTLSYARATFECFSAGQRECERATLHLAGGVWR